MHWNPIRSRGAVLYGCLFLSGWTSLTYELLWIKQITLVIGGTLYAISAVLCAFMAGLALGAWGGARILTRFTEHPDGLVRLYGVLEGIIGLYALAFPFLLHLVEAGYPLLLTLSFGSDTLLHFWEFVLCALLMLPATFMMGATLPVIGRWRIGDRQDRIFTDLSVLYGVNTLGAMGGVLYTQFGGTRFLGIEGTLYSAVALNLLVCAVCWLWRAEAMPAKDAPAPSRTQSKPAKDESTPDRKLAWLLLFLFFFSGMVALSSEILWTRVLVFPLGHSLYSFAIILATFLFGIGLGSLVAEKILGPGNWVAKFIAVETAVAVLGLLAIPALGSITVWTQELDKLFYDVNATAARTLWMRSLMAFALMILPTLGFGMIFPLAGHIHFHLFGTVERTLGNSYAVNTVGAIAGTVLTPFLFVALFGIRGSLFVLFGGLLLLAVTAWAWRRGKAPRRFLAGYATAALLMGVVWAASPPSAATHTPGEGNLARIEIDTPPERLNLLDYKEGDFSTLSVVEDARNGGRTLYVDGFSTATASDSLGGSAYMQAMGLVPMLLHPAPKDALVMCFGTGSTLGTVAEFPDVNVDGVEIDDNVLGMAHWFERWNHGVLDKPNVDFHIQDARRFIRWTGQRYDVITLEPMSPVQAGVNNLYSREFYAETRARLKPGGLMMQWLPLHLVTPEDARAILTTFRAEFPHVSVWNSFLTRIVLLVGSDQPVRLDKQHFDAVTQNPRLKPLAEGIGLYSFIDFMDFYITESKALKTYWKEAPVVTDDNRLLEHSDAVLVPPLKRETDESFLNLLLARVGQAPPITGVTSREAAYYEQQFRLRTAQRLSVFAQRYRGPGYSLFAQKEYESAVARVRAFLEGLGDRTVRLSENGWSPAER
ncbi:fused MFS/spermidine synthase [Nitrospina gracilis]|uniref:fused MFS/spermidine synthase n=1 Tax=Nitrospina gracilis TaxID=35801 RepID=UPI001F1D8F5D|nr:fused MFS/spermidine synthase [Nitrospina gracilis]MCF8720053.1 spermidine synthase [Nitrospina gracilis Nb-211]